MRTLLKIDLITPISLLFISCCIIFYLTNEVFSMTIVLDQKTVTPDSLTITISKEEYSTDEGQSNLFATQKKIADYFHSLGQHYLFYSEQCPNQNPITITAIPFTPSKGFFEPMSRYFQQLKVLFRICYGGVEPNPKAAQAFKDYAKNTKVAAQAATIHHLIKSPKCPFCNEQRQGIQLIHEGKYTLLFYNMRQVGKEQTDLLIIPKNHVENFDSISDREGQEMQAVAAKVYTIFQQTHANSLRFHIFNKSGSTAGQTVGHSHTHMMIESNKTLRTQTFWAVLKNMVWSTKLSDAIIQQRVQTLKQQLKDLEGKQD